jgi:hypothetical protein
VFISGERRNKALYISKKHDNAEYHAIGFENNKVLRNQKAYVSALKINLSKKGVLLIDEMTIN